MKEISDPIFKTDNPALLEEIKANDIRNSVLWTGKINDKNAETENNDVSKEGENNKNESNYPHVHLVYLQRHLIYVQIVEKIL